MMSLTSRPMQVGERSARTSASCSKRRLSVRNLLSEIRGLHAILLDPVIVSAEASPFIEHVCVASLLLTSYVSVHSDSDFDFDSASIRREGNEVGDDPAQRHLYRRYLWHCSDGARPLAQRHLTQRLRPMVRAVQPHASPPPHHTPQPPSLTTTSTSRTRVFHITTTHLQGLHTSALRVSSTQHRHGPRVSGRAQCLGCHCGQRYVIRAVPHRRMHDITPMAVTCAHIARRPHPPSPASPREELQTRILKGTWADKQMQEYEHASPSSSKANNNDYETALGTSTAPRHRSHHIPMVHSTVNCFSENEKKNTPLMMAGRLLRLHTAVASPLFGQVVSDTPGCSPCFIRIPHAVHSRLRRCVRDGFSPSTRRRPRSH